MNRSLGFLYYGGMLVITVLEILECVLYVLTSRPYTPANVIYYILVVILAFCIGILFDSFRRITKVVKMYEGMSIDQQFMKVNVFFCSLLLLGCLGLAIPHEKDVCLAFTSYVMYTIFTVITQTLFVVVFNIMANRSHQDSNIKDEEDSDFGASE